MSAPRTKAPAIHGQLTAQILPRWLRDAVGALHLRELADLLNDARVVTSMPWHGEHVPRFRSIAKAARAALKRLAGDGLEAKRVVYELCVLVPGLLKEEAQAIPAYRWIQREWTTITPSEHARIVKKLPRRRGPPEERGTLQAHFALFRAQGYTAKESLTTLASLVRRSKEAIRSALKRAARDGWSPSRLGRGSAGLCRCKKMFPHCEQCVFWFRPASAPSGPAMAPEPLTLIEHRCIGPLQLASVHALLPVCIDCAPAELTMPHRKVSGRAEMRCPHCKGHAYRLQRRPLPHRHCIVCDRPHAQASPAPLLAPVGHGRWACNDPADPGGCYRATRKMRDDIRSEDDGRWPPCCRRRCPAGRSPSAD
jgi:hypothetical protein